MAGMKRFIAYIYGYEKAKKTGNTEIDRIELQVKESRLVIHQNNFNTA